MADLPPDACLLWPGGRLPRVMGCTVPPRGLLEHLASLGRLRPVLTGHRHLLAVRAMEECPDQNCHLPRTPCSFCLSLARGGNPIPPLQLRTLPEEARPQVAMEVGTTMREMNTLRFLTGEGDDAAAAAGFSPSSSSLWE